MKRLIQITLIIFLAICFTTPAMAGSKYPALRDSVDPELQKAFDKALTDYFGAKFWELAKAKKDTAIYRKSGTRKNHHADGGVVAHRKNGYIIVGIVEHPEGGQGLAELVVLVDDLMEKMK